MWAKFYFGHNEVTDTSGIIEVDGEQLVALESDDDGRLLLTVDVYRPGGSGLAHVAKLRRNAWAFGAEGYRLTTNPIDLQLIEVETERTIVRASVHGKVAVLHEADLVMPDGTPVVVGDEVTVGGISFADVRFNALGSVISIRNGFLALG